MNDVARPVRHIRPARGWLNDPNGLAHVDGTWHVFFQYREAEPRHGDISWGHATSTDLYRWEEHPVALAPRSGGLDAIGCWSGCCTIDEGVPTFCYTAVGTTAADGVALVARGDTSLQRWTPATVASAGRVGAPDAETRDPFVVTIDGRRHVIQGHGGPATPAQVLVYDATDLDNWRLLGPLLTIDDPVAARVAAADIWECPNLVQVDGEWVLVVSLWRQGQLSGVRWLRGALDTTGAHPTFHPVDGGVLDDGDAFYAPQLLDDAGRVLLWGWSWELGRSEEWLDEHGWAGVLTAPRELHLAGGRLVQTLVAEVAGQAGDEVGRRWSAAQHPCVQVEATRDGTLVCEQADGPGEVPLAAGDRVLVDGSLVEVYGATATRTTRVYPTKGSHWRLDGAGSVRAMA